MKTITSQTISAIVERSIASSYPEGLPADYYGEIVVSVSFQGGKPQHTKVTRQQTHAVSSLLDKGRTSVENT